MSEVGVTRFVPATRAAAGSNAVSGDQDGRGGYVEFSKLYEWEAERRAYSQLERIPFFRLYPRWKVRCCRAVTSPRARLCLPCAAALRSSAAQAHYTWKQQLQATKRTRCCAALSEHLFVLDADLAPALLRVQARPVPHPSP